MQEALPYYPPTVNDPEAFKVAMDVAGRWRTLQLLAGFMLMCGASWAAKPSFLLHKLACYFSPPPGQPARWV